MSELADRMGMEQDFAKRLSRLTARQRRELREKLGTPPDVSRITAADWQRWEDERRQELTLIILAIILASYRQHVAELVPGGTAPEGIEADVYRGALAKAGSLASESAASTMATARDIVTSSVEIIRTGTAADIDGVLVSALGPGRDSTTAITVTTQAQTEGANQSAIPLLAAGMNLVTRWYTQNDNDVCGICDPLHGKSVDLWGPVLENALGPGGTRAIESIVNNGGPPAHPRCRCWLETKAEPRPAWS